LRVNRVYTFHFFKMHKFRAQMLKTYQGNVNVAK
jgi:hypothetical protein